MWSPLFTWQRNNVFPSSMVSLWTCHCDFYLLFSVTLPWAGHSHGECKPSQVPRAPSCNSAHAQSWPCLSLCPDPCQGTGELGPEHLSQGGREVGLCELSLHCPIRLNIQNTNSSIELLRLFRWPQSIIPPAQSSLLSVGHLWLYWSHAHKVGPACNLFPSFLLTFSLTSSFSLHSSFVSQWLLNNSDQRLYLYGMPVIKRWLQWTHLSFCACFISFSKVLSPDVR